MSAWPAIVLVLASAASAVAAGNTAFEDCMVLRPDGILVRFQVEIAATPDTRTTGLMNRGALTARDGMWFDFEYPGSVVMWMKNTLIPLDMAFIDEHGVIVGIQSHTVPLSLDRLTVSQPVRYVLEVNAGELAELGIDPGARVLLSPDSALER